MVIILELYINTFHNNKTCNVSLKSNTNTKSLSFCIKTVFKKRTFHTASTRLVGYIKNLVVISIFRASTVLAFKICLTVLTPFDTSLPLPSIQAQPKLVQVAVPLSVRS